MDNGVTGWLSCHDISLYPYHVLARGISSLLTYLLSTNIMSSMCRWSWDHEEVIRSMDHHEVAITSSGPQIMVPWVWGHLYVCEDGGTTIITTTTRGIHILPCSGVVMCSYLHTYHEHGVYVIYICMMMCHYTMHVYVYVVVICMSSWASTSCGSGCTAMCSGDDMQWGMLSTDDGMYTRQQ